MTGKDGFVLTGQLGDVMKESARIALSYVRGHAAELGIDESDFTDREFHLHVPAGAIPKDGPSAGITMTTALASLLSGRPVRHTVGMTGEITLQGRVLPIGGPQAEGARGPRRRAHRRDHPRAQPRRPRGRPGGRPRGDEVPPGDDDRRGARARTRARALGGSAARPRGRQWHDDPLHGSRRRCGRGSSGCYRVLRRAGLRTGGRGDGRGRMGGPAPRTGRRPSGYHDDANPGWPGPARAVDVPESDGHQPCAERAGERARHPRLTFVVDSVNDVFDGLRPHGAELVGEVAQYEDIYLYGYVRGPAGIIVGLVEELR